MSLASCSLSCPIDFSWADFVSVQELLESIVKWSRICGGLILSLSDLGVWGKDYIRFDIFRKSIITRQIMDLPFLNLTKATKEYNTPF